MALLWAYEIYSNIDPINMHKVSVIIPAYNSQETIGVCIKSALSSDYQNFEVIVVDDGSTDKTSDIVNEFKNIKILTKKNGGAASARNYGARLADGDLFYFLDSDVVIDPDTIRRMTEGISEYEADLVNVCYSLDPANEGIIHHYKALVDYVNYTPKSIRGAIHVSSLQKDRKKLYTIGGGGDFMSRVAFEKIGGYDEERYTGANVEREELLFRFWSSGFSSISDTTIKTSHHFPGFFTMLKNYHQRIRGTFELKEGNNLKFGNYNETKTLVTTGVALFLLSSPIFFIGFAIDYLTTAYLLIILLLFFIIISWDFFSMSFKMKGLKKTVCFLPIHILSQAAILIFAVTSLFLIGIKKISK